MPVGKRKSETILAEPFLRPGLATLSNPQLLLTPYRKAKVPVDSSGGTEHALRHSHSVDLRYQRADTVAACTFRRLAEAKRPEAHIGKAQMRQGQKSGRFLYVQLTR